MFIVLSSVKTYIKCRLPSSLFFSDSRLLFSESLTAKALRTLIAGIREKLDFVCALDAMINKTDILNRF